MPNYLFFWPRVIINNFFFSFKAVTPMVQDAKCVAIDPLDHNAVSRWRESNRAVSIYRLLVTLKQYWKKNLVQTFF